MAFWPQKGKKAYFKKQRINFLTSYGPKRRHTTLLFFMYKTFQILAICQKSFINLGLSNRGTYDLSF